MTKGAIYIDTRLTSEDFTLKQNLNDSHQLKLASVEQDRVGSAANMPGYNTAKENTLCTNGVISLLPSQRESVGSTIFLDAIGVQ